MNWISFSELARISELARWDGTQEITLTVTYFLSYSSLMIDAHGILY